MERKHYLDNLRWATVLLVRWCVFGITERPRIQSDKSK